ncbi:hypothetical protein C3B58_01335 [Lactonifactor longoviformis]|uniref:SipW-cognate class signal peptide n=2 Tax=Lactonifactor TaxID=420345 RepID=A0A1M4VYH5_9CLOT|nr:SipW-dependent-type signal peptide-containing protein [Lactonifactor longoviformis]POP34807.1 hypothetical protein C3B58_01335 [Lactonifactor longoviformis]SHE73999.1 SipW-cognate class signal peptide [Lactonifactor longoviformis DSM 17459]
MMNRKKLTAVVASVALVAVLGIGGTLMYFTDKDEKTNVITLGKVDGTLDEDSTDGDKTDDGIEYGDIQPGDTLNKVPTVTLADDSQDAYLRVEMKIDGLDDYEGYADAIESGLDIGSNWKKGPDGYYYYNVKLSAGDEASKTSQPLFTTVVIPATWGNEVSEATFKINLVAELIQADNFEDGQGNIIRDADTNMIIGWNNTGTIEPAK